MKTEENKAVRHLAANGVIVVATYNHDDGLVGVRISRGEGEEEAVVSGDLFLQAGAMVRSNYRYGGGYACADHGVHDGYECAVCHPPKPKEVKALPEPTPAAAAIVPAEGVPF